MKTIRIPSLIIIVSTWFLMYCSEEHTPSSPSITGQWKLVEQKIGIAGPGEWKEVSDGDTFEFKTDGSFEKSFHPNCTTGTFEVIGDTLRLHYDCPEYDVTWDYSFRDFSNTSFTLSPITVMCIEGCQFRYQRIN